MSTPRPTVAPQLIASLIDSAPDRVRRRLEQAPRAAATWTWRETPENWTVDTGGESVALPLGHVHGVEQLRCSCLLSPRCFHVLACLSSLVVAMGESPVDPEIPTPGPEEESDSVAPEPSQSACARTMADAIGRLLYVGAAQAGLMVQSGLLRAVHQCRAEGLHRLGSLALRVVTGVNEVRGRVPDSDPVQLAEDVAEALECAHHLANDKAVESYWIGTARRAQ